MTVALAGVVRVIVPESEMIFAGSMSVASRGQMARATDSAPRRSERLTQQPARLLDAVEVYVKPTTHLRNVACERKAVTIFEHITRVRNQTIGLNLNCFVLYLCLSHSVHRFEILIEILSKTKLLRPKPATMLIAEAFES